MKAIRTLPYAAILAALSLAGCSSSRQLAQNGGEVDDLYGNSADAVVYAAPQREERQLIDEQPTRRAQAERRGRNTNPDFLSETEQQELFQSDEYYSDLSARRVQRGISPDPGWATENYNDGFVDGFNAAGGNRWNRWGWNNTGFWTGLSLGLGASPWGWNRWGGYDPFWGGGYAYSPWGWNSFYDPFWGYNSFNRWGYNSWADPYWGGGWYNRPVVVVNNNYNNVVGAARNNYTVGARNTGRTDRYNGNFNNTPRTGNPTDNGGRRSGTLSPSTNTPTYSNSRNPDAPSRDSYSRDRANNRGTYYYSDSDNSGRVRSNESYSAPSTSSPSYGNSSRGSSAADAYYSRPRQNSRGTYVQPSDGGLNSRSSSPSYNSGNSGGFTAPSRSSYESPSRSTYSQPNTNSSYSSPSPAPSYNSGSRGGSSSGGYSGGSSSGGGGGSRGPR
ncbi:pilus assembly protein [Tellurirhabdus rosea]|uniref:hypothetical protein n=1 Tax=Tellurirhabdus rosea TaxID=2674997 RepID=UPI00225700D9|nr:hypothetical protein [Tellurirhabdus rosea]